MTIVVGNKAQNIISEFIGKRINSPEQRLLQGVVALGVQPFIDLRNKGTDKDTRAVSTARIIGKIVAGTITGVAIRYGSIGLIKKIARTDIADPKGFDKIRTLFTPDLSKFQDSMKNMDPKTLYDNYLKTMGTKLAIVTMLFTNFLIDAPMTKVITKVLTPRIKSKIKEEDENKNQFEKKQEVKVASS